MFYRIFLKDKLDTEIYNQETIPLQKVSLELLVRCACTQCLHITYMAIYTLVGYKPQSKHIYSRGTAAITSQWAKLQYTSELFIQKDLWQSHMHCVIRNPRGILCSLCCGGELSPASAAGDNFSRSPPAHSSRTCCPTAQDPFYSAIHNNKMKCTSVTLLSLHVPLSYFALFYAITWRCEKALSGSGFLLLARKNKGHFHHIKPARVNGCIKPKNSE